jgi:serine/threonine-protein kinase
MKIDQYEIVATLKGGTCPVYEAKAPGGDRVVVKAVSTRGLSAEARERFLRESQIGQSLDHPNLLRLTTAGESGDLLFQVMPFLEGTDLNRLFAGNTPLPWEHKISIMEQIASGLAYAHERKYVHRDIKPANIFWDKSGRIIILDFGIARTEDSKLTQAGATVGTLNYMSPEQIRASPCTTASDIFSAGIVFYQLCTGRHPFLSTGGSIAEIMSAILFNTPPALATVISDAPQGLEFILTRMLDKDPANRIQSGADLIPAIRLLRHSLSAPVPAPKPAAAPASAAQPQPADDPNKTAVIPNRARPQGQPSLPPTPISVTPPPKPPSPQRGPEAPLPSFSYCPNCTHGNPIGARTCSKCSYVFGQGGPSTSQFEFQTKSNPTLLYVLIALVIVLLILVFIIVSNRG